ncbi:MAG: ketoacyl-ACP synthase III [Candidatus Omnitrophica bacterium]|nr:ketoacyl-ACP synthase III [Candidatus Omnitrophota bacterium]MCM8799340.1 ketoacyl-ACP synthase III [Candidatus Omnitrophota bacterium]
MKRIGIIGLGEYFPDKVLTNQDLEKMVDTSDEWITTRTGIKQRRIVKEGQATSDLAIKASKSALKEANISAQDLDLIIVATITPDMQFPSVSCLVQKALGAKKVACFDISAACAGFVYGIAIAQQFLANSFYKNALVVGAEVLSSITDWKDRNTCVLFGDGAGAAVLSEVKRGGILSVYLGSDGSFADLLKVPAGGSRYPATHQTVDNRLHYIKMQGNEVFKFAVKYMTESAQIALNKAGLSCEDVDCFIPHQANLRILLAVAKKLGLAKDKIYLNIEKYGNISSASTATALCEAVKEKRIKRGDIVVLDAFGAGFVWGACVIEW